MALHPVRLPKSARDLCRVLAMQRSLLKALCIETIDAELIDETWLHGAWKTLDETWIKKFCRKRKFSILVPIKAVARAPLAARRSLYDEFCRQIRVQDLFNAGGMFQRIDSLNEVTPQLAAEVHRIFIRFYQFLSHETAAEWNGYEFPRDRCIRNDAYRAALEESNRSITSVCPYCDGANDEPELDHYYPKEAFPFLSCSPWNLVPVCHLCNKLSAKGSRLALSPEVAEPTAEWLHPFFRPASAQAQIRLSGTPKDSVPKLYSPDPAEQTRLNNHSELIRTLAKRWTRVAAVRFDVLVGEVSRKQKDNPAYSMENHVKTKLEDYLAAHGREASSMVHAAVCLAVLEKRAGYIEEFETPNAPALE